MALDQLEVRPLTLTIGAEITGVNIDKPLSNSQAEAVHDALMKHQVIFFRDQQDMTYDGFEAFGRLFGEFTESAHRQIAAIEGHPDIVTIKTDENSKRAPGEAWHSDSSFEAEPPMGSILYLHTVPEVGGDTTWASMYAAYDALSPRMKTYLEGLTCLHDARPGTAAAAPRQENNWAIHPVVRTHPVTGKKALYVSAYMSTRIQEVSKEESDAILSFLFAHCANPNFAVRFRWTPHSVAFWDNRCTQHRVIFDYFPQRRAGWRVTVAGEKPV